MFHLNEGGWRVLEKGTWNSKIESSTAENMTVLQAQHQRQKNMQHKVSYIQVLNLLKSTVALPILGAK